MTATAADLAKLPADARRNVLTGLTAEELQALEYEWKFWARPDQLPPPGDWRTWAMISGRGAGKLIDENEVIPTPDGWCRLGDIEVGDQVFDEAGGICEVLATHDAMPETAYRLHFSDDSTIDCCGDHLWVTWTHAERKAFLRSPYDDTSKLPPNWPAWRRRRLCGNNAWGAAELALLEADGWHVDRIRTYPDSPGPQVRTTQEIVDTLTYGLRDDANHCIPTCGALQLPERELPIDPWALGYWLANGSARDGDVTCGSYQGNEDHPHIAEAFAGAGYDTTVRNYPEKGQARLVSTRLRAELRKAGLLSNKHVPLEYLRSSARQRLALLRGLLDGDGTANLDRDTVEFSNMDADLAAAVSELAMSLGQKPVTNTKRATLYGMDCGEAHRVTWRPTIQVFSLPRKADRLSFDGAQTLRNHHRMIVAAEPIASIPMRCLTVSSPNAMFLVGRAMIPTHNTRAAAEYIRNEVESGRHRLIAIIGPTADSIRRDMVEGSSGLLAIAPPWCRPEYEPSTRRVCWPNKAVAYLLSSEEPDRARGLNISLAWADELSSWSNQQAMWDMLQLGLRISGPKGDTPRIVLSTTPKPGPLLKSILAADSTVITRARTIDNVANLDKSTLAYLKNKYGGTRLGRQELDAELLDDAEGALWSRDLLEQCRIKRGDAPAMLRIVVAVDPPGGSSKSNAECGIVVAGLGKDRHGYILADLSGRYSPEGWARRVIESYKGHKADKIVAEQNFGGAMVESTLRSVDQNAPIKMVVASRGKQLRAEPISSMYEQRRIHHVGEFPALEDQMTSWDPLETGPSPDRIDACIYACTELMGDAPMSINPQALQQLRVIGAQRRAIRGY